MRPQGWESLLAAHIADARLRAFAWGEHDCVLWCADWLRKLTGSDPAADWRGKYATEEEALAVLDSLGCYEWAGLADKFLPQVLVQFAKRGDVMLHPVNGSLGICDGAHAYFVIERGLTRLPFLTCPKAWRVG